VRKEGRKVRKDGRRVRTEGRKVKDATKTNNKRMEMRIGGNDNRMKGA
jgi:hypothetical protein